MKPSSARVNTCNCHSLKTVAPVTSKKPMPPTHSASATRTDLERLLVWRRYAVANTAGATVAAQSCHEWERPS